MIRRRRHSRRCSVVLALALTVAASGLAACNSGVQSQPSIHYPVASPGYTEVSVGQHVTSNGIEIAYLDAQCTSTDPPEPGHIWAGFKLYMRNSNTTKFVFPLDTPIYASSDDKWEATDPFASPVAGHFPQAWQPGFPKFDINPDASETGWLVFDVVRPQDYISFKVYQFQLKLKC